MHVIKEKDGPVMETKYNPINSGHEDSNQIGLDYQEFVYKILKEKLHIDIEYYKTKFDQYNIGESKQGFEIKFDGPCTSTKRLSIEIAEKTDGNNLNWIPSGIYRNDNTINHVRGNYGLIYIFSKRLLQILYEKKTYLEDEWPRDYPTVKKFYLPLDHADYYCDKKILIINDNNENKINPIIEDDDNNENDQYWKRF